MSSISSLHLSILVLYQFCRLPRANKVSLALYAWFSTFSRLPSGHLAGVFRVGTCACILWILAYAMHILVLKINSFEKHRESCASGNRYICVLAGPGSMRCAMQQKEWSEMKKLYEIMLLWTRISRRHRVVEKWSKRYDASKTGMQSKSYRHQLPTASRKESKEKKYSPLWALWANISADAFNEKRQHVNTNTYCVHLPVSTTI